MTLFDIILLGYFVNIVLSIIFIMVFTFLSVMNIAVDPKSILELQQLENNLAELKRLNKMAPFQEKYSDFFSFIIPFASVIKFYTLVNDILREGNLSAYAESEIRRLRKVIEEQRKKEND